MNSLNLFLKRKIFIAIAVFLLIFLGFVIFWYFSSYKKDNKLNKGDVVEVYVAKNNILNGEEIKEDKIEKSIISVKLFDSKYITNKKEIVGKNAIKDISTGEILSFDKIENEAKKNQNYLNFSYYIPEGYRAISIPVIYYGEQSLLNVGDNIDLVSAYYDKDNEKIISKTILSYKKIILINGKTKNNSSTDNENVNFSTLDGISSEGSSIFSGVFGSDSTNMSGLQKFQIILTFYLTPSEVEMLINSLQLGPLFASICPSGNKTNMR